MENMPTVFLGEFDSLLGPHVVFASECFRHPEVQSLTVNSLQPQLTFVDGDVLIGSHVASGSLRASYKEYARDIAARVLTSYENRRDSCVFADCGCPAVGSFSFNLHDILARGEQRRFCIIVLHSSYEEILASWSLLTFFCKNLMASWQKQAHQRYTAEYSSMCNLELLREEARQKPLRTLFELLRQETESEDDVRARVHGQTEQLLLTAFDTTVAGRAPRADSWILMRREQVEAEMQHRVTDLSLSNPVRAVIPADAQLNAEKVAVKPLSVWLVEHLLYGGLAEDAASLTDARSPKSGARRKEEISLLLTTLLTGNQVVISGDGAKDTASLALSLAYVLPSELRKLCVNSDEYRMPYQSSLLSFSESFLKRHEIVTSAATTRVEPLHTSDKVLLDLSTIEVEGLLHVRVEGGRIVSVALCASDAVAGRPSTLVTRLLALVAHTAATVRAAPAPHFLCIKENIPLLKLLMVQMQQLVSEYTTRGRVYTAVFRSQEIEANAHILDAGAPRREESSTTTRAPHPDGQNPLRSAVGSALRFFSTSWRTPTGGAAPARRVPGAKRAQLTLTKHAHVEHMGAPLQNERYIFGSASPEDHYVLVFLGSTIPV